MSTMILLDLKRTKNILFRYDDKTAAALNTCMVIFFLFIFYASTVSVGETLLCPAFLRGLWMVKKKKKKKNILEGVSFSVFANRCCYEQLIRSASAIMTFVVMEDVSF